MANDHCNLVQILERLVQVVGKSLCSAAHRVDVHAVAAGTHDATQAASAKLQGLVERLDKVGLVFLVEHGLNLGAGLLVISITEPRLGLCGHLLN